MMTNLAVRFNRFYGRIVLNNALMSIQYYRICRANLEVCVSWVFVLVHCCLVGSVSVRLGGFFVRYLLDRVEPRSGRYGSRHFSLERFQVKSDSKLCLVTVGRFPNRFAGDIVFSKLLT